MRWWMLALLTAGCSSDWKGDGDDPDAKGDTSAPAADDTGLVDADGDGYAEDEDCDDADPEVHPGAEERCNGVDDDCDGALGAGEDGDEDADGVLDCADACPVRVDASAAPGGDGTVARPFQLVQEGIDAAPGLGCTEVRVAPGTYPENVDFHGLDLDVASTDGPEVTVIDGGGAGSVVTFASGESSAARLAGFTLTNGAAERGAGIHVEGASPVVEECIVEDNAVTGTGMGGGIYLYDSSAEIRDCTIQRNEACPGGPDEGCDGGGVAIVGGAPLLQGNWILDNAAGDGGGIWVAHGGALIVQNVLACNTADDQGTVDDAGHLLTGQGGGIDFQSDTAGVVFAANVVVHNTAGSHGGGVAITGFYVEDDVAEPTVANSVVAWNAAPEGAGVLAWGIGAPTLVNLAVVENDGDGISGQYANAAVRYCDAWDNAGDDFAGALAGLADSNGNLSADPLFRDATDDGDPTNDDLRPASSSPLVDAGDPDLADPDGSRSDIGAFGGPWGGWTP